MFGIEIDGPTSGFCDNNSIVQNVTNPESTLGKKHNAIAYHKVHECVAQKALRIHYEKGSDNCSDVLTKVLPKDDHYWCCGALLHQ
jgi:hypothetical protein